MSSHGAVMPFPRSKGIILVLIAAIFWGISGTFAQYLFQVKAFTASWLVVNRLLLSGLILLFYSHAVKKQNIFTIWKARKDRVKLMVFGIFGMLGVQYTYFLAIQHGNAATATVLQYLAPVLIACYVFVKLNKLPAKYELAAIILALVGTFLLVTNGNVHSMSISGAAFFWGILSAFALAFYTLFPGELLNKWGSYIIVGWGMFIGGICFSFISPPWVFKGSWSFSSFMAVVAVIMLGTVIAFFCYMESLKYLSASETSLLACAEPLSAAFLSVAWLHVPFGTAEWIGTFCIIATIVIFSTVKKQKT